MIRREQITEAALSLVGTPFHPQGRLPGVGLDCIGVTVAVARMCGLPVADRTNYPMRANGELRGEIEAQLIRVDGEPMEGDVLLMAFDKEPHHVAILVDGGRIVHAHMRARKCVVQNYSDYWRGMVCGVYRFPGVE